MRRPLRLSPPRLKSSETDSTASASSRDRPTEIARVKEDGPSRCPLCRSMPADRAGTLLDYPSSTFLRLSAAGVRERPCARAEPSRSGAPAHSLRTRICLAWTNGLSLSLPRHRHQFAPRRRRSCSQGVSGNGQAKAPLLLKKAELKAEQDALTPFDTNRAPLFRARLLRLGADDSRFSSDLSRNHHRRLVDGNFHGGTLGILCRPCSRRASAVARTSASVFRLRRWQRLWSDQRCSNPTVRLLEGAPTKASPVFATNGDVGGELADAQSPRNRFIYRMIWSRA